MSLHDLHAEAVAAPERDRFRLLLEASGALLGTLDLEEMLPRVVELARQILAADAYALWRAPDEGHEWRLQTASGLSEEYQRAATAAIEGSATTIELDGVMVASDIETTEWLNPAHRAAHAREGNRALLVVPLRHRGNVIGTLAFYYRTARTFDDEDVSAATALANLAAAAIGTADLYRRQLDAAEQRQFLADASALLAASLDDEQTLAGIARLAVPRLADWCIVDVLDPETSALRGVAVAATDERAESVLREMRQLYPPSLNSPQPSARALRTGDTVVFPQFTPESLRETAIDARHFGLIAELAPTAAIAVPMRARGHTLGAITFAWTTADRAYSDEEVRLAEELGRHAALAVDNARLYRAEREARERLSVLADASTLLASSLDYETTLANVAALIVPDFADWCAVDLVGEDGQIRRIAVVHKDRAKSEWAERSKLLYAPDPDEPEGTGRAIRTREPLLYREITDELLQTSTRNEGHLEVLQNLGMRSAMVVPLVTRGRTIGALMFVSDDERAYDEDDLDFAQHLGRRAAAAVDNAQLYGRSEEARALFDTLFATAPIGLAFLDSDLRYVRVNHALGEINGVSPADHVGRRIDEVVPGLEPRVLESMRAAIETGVPIVDQEETGETPAAPGVPRHWLASYYPVRSSDGETIGLGVVVGEITERKRTETVQRFLAEASTVLASSLDYEGTLVRVAQLAVPGFADWCIVDVVRDGGDLARMATAHADPAKVAFAEALGRRWPGGPDDPAGPHAVVRTGSSEFVPVISEERLAASAKDDEHLRMLRAIGLGSYISVPLVARGRVLGAITFATAESGRHYDERDLAVAEELGRRAAVAIDNARLYGEVERRAQAAQALAFVGDGVFLIDRDSLIRLWNPAAARITSLPEADVVGRRAEEAIPGWESLGPRVPPGGRAETLPVELDGRELWLSISAVAFEGGTVYAFRDLTEERALEKLKSDFVATISHELRTPLAAIYGAALTLRRSDVELERRQRDSLLDVVAAEADRLARIVNDVLWASRLEADTMPVTIESCDGAALIRDVADAAATYTPANLRLVVDDPGELPPVAADPEKVRQVLTNLVDNAIKYSPDGGEIRLRLEQHDRRIRFVVRDEGLGIPPAERERVFEKFYRLDPNLTRGVGGTGLGLYICRELVRRMGGSIWAEGTGGRGIQFVVDLAEAR